jgi:site-specific recombinase XerD
MSVFRPPRSKHYHYDFWLRGHRFHGTTGAASKRDAKEIERQERDKALHTAATIEAEQAALRGAAPLTLDVAAGQWWHEVGQHRADAGDCWRAIEGMVDHFGKDKLLGEITDRDVAAWVARRRGERVWGKTKFKDDREARRIAPATVNRTTVDALRRIFGHARRKWKRVYASEPNWREHRLKEPEERVRELSGEEQAALDAVAREGYAKLYRFARLSGLRLKSCLIRKSDVKWQEGRIETISKGGRINRIPISDPIRELLGEVWDDHPEFVFTYTAKTTREDKRGKRVAKKRYPITPAGLRTQWKRDRKAATALCPSLVDYRFHDNRHTAASRIVRSSGNLKIAQKLLNHARIGTTAKYAHVLDDEVRAAMNAVPDGDTESQAKSQAKPAESA